MTAPAVVEIVGPGGSGKSSLVGLLAGDDRAVVHASLRNHLPLGDFVRSGARVFRPFLAQIPRIPSRRWYRLEVMVQLQAHAAVVARLAARGTHTIVLDQGPVYLLSILQRAHAAAGRRNALAFQRYWDESLAFWRRTLRLLVVLDAPDMVLYERIQTRATRHPLLHRELQSAMLKIQRGRESRARIIDALLAGRDAPALLGVDTSALSPVQVAEQVRSRLRSTAPVTHGRDPVAVDVGRG
ncbi:MAG TPA: hypothetical protein VFU06_09225 [Longimicrobiales bacterium]|nr:hypothetical protein [Longimicrobiales bacterium]